MGAAAADPLGAADRVGTESHEALDLLGYVVRELVARRGRRARLVQIGAHDGVANDPVLPLIEADLVEGVLVEPIPAFASKLRALHADRPHLTVVEAAIAAREGALAMYQAVRSDGQIVNERVTSFDRAVVEHELAVTRRFEPDLDPQIEIRAVAVPTISVTALFERTGWPSLDILVIDAEGHDPAIVREFLNAGLVTDILQFEANHIRRADYPALLDLMRDTGFVWARSGRDIMAVRKGSGLRAVAP